jgi:hypothetical protein
LKEEPIYDDKSVKHQLRRNQMLFKAAQSDIEDFHKRNQKIKERLNNCLKGLSIR